jgi:putative PIN family toxin of toxin-antitoxin system
LSAEGNRRYQRLCLWPELPAGQNRRFLELAPDGTINLTASKAILDEMADVLGRKFDWTEEDIAEGRRRIAALARTVIPSVQLNVVKEDPPDNRILECAVAAGSDYIVTGDRDLLRLRSYDSIKSHGPLAVPGSGARGGAEGDRPRAVISAVVSPFDPYAVRLHGPGKLW